VGEGTGKAPIWIASTNTISTCSLEPGEGRLPGHTVALNHGRAKATRDSRLYTSTLFRYKPQFFDGLDRPSNWRSFICPEYQKSYARCCCCGKESLRFVLLHRRRPVLFGP